MLNYKIQRQQVSAMQQTQHNKLYQIVETLTHSKQQKYIKILGINDYLPSFIKSKANINILIAGNIRQIFFNFLWNQFYSKTLLREIYQHYRQMGTSNQSSFFRINGSDPKNLYSCLGWSQNLINQHIFNIKSKQISKISERTEKPMQITIQAFLANGTAKSVKIDIIPYKKSTFTSQESIYHFLTQNAENYDMIFEYCIPQYASSRSTFSKFQTNQMYQKSTGSTSRVLTAKENNLNGLKKIHKKTNTYNNEMPKTYNTMNKKTKSQISTVKKSLSSSKKQNKQNLQEEQKTTKKKPTIIPQKKYYQLDDVSLEDILNVNQVYKEDRELCPKNDKNKSTNALTHPKKPNRQQFLYQIINKKQQLANKRQIENQRLQANYKQKLAEQQQLHMNQLVKLKNDINLILQRYSQQLTNYKQQNQTLRAYIKSLQEKNEQQIDDIANYRVNFQEQNKEINQHKKMIENLRSQLEKQDKLHNEKMQLQRNKTKNILRRMKDLQQQSENMF